MVTGGMDSCFEVVCCITHIQVTRVWVGPTFRGGVTSEHQGANTSTLATAPSQGGKQPVPHGWLSCEVLAPCQCLTLQHRIGMGDRRRTASEPSGCNASGFHGNPHCHLPSKRKLSWRSPVSIKHLSSPSKCLLSSC